MVVDGISPENGEQKQRLLEYERIGIIDDAGRASQHVQIRPTSDGEEIAWF